MNSNSGMDTLESLESDSEALFAKGDEDTLGNCPIFHLLYVKANSVFHQAAAQEADADVGLRSIRGGWTVLSCTVRAVRARSTPRQGTWEL